MKNNFTEAVIKDLGIEIVEVYDSIYSIRSVNSLEIMLLWRCVCQIDSIQSKRVQENFTG